MMVVQVFVSRVISHVVHVWVQMQTNAYNAQAEQIEMIILLQHLIIVLVLLTTMKKMCSYAVNVIYHAEIALVL